MSGTHRRYPRLAGEPVGIPSLQGREDVKALTPFSHHHESNEMHAFSSMTNASLYLIQGRPGPIIFCNSSVIMRPRNWRAEMFSRIKLGRHCWSVLHSARKKKSTFGLPVGAQCADHRRSAAWMNLRPELDQAWHVRSSQTHNLGNRVKLP